ncbi:peptidoglycan recognition protein family protein [Heliophilum fasciatum]|uniref:N-acetylmuramoyl-L-alanine amidase n=1 Tax=Heliophilum fasciatum TaxID=35700 RepID=A0A4R2RF61_9FIRM|nr:N-acetylmuramoyl-L-alanine amidase [Heliophilum fasciatum]MCW2279118.1 N-acetylmuramoyl-L-alanine amidase [Heliophilum fasciatum]TCP61254.1 N-acetylmuramoyl-L-alanine amidase [Heliophilum fasciatum]
MNVIQDFVQVGAANRPGYPMTSTFITVHNTGNSSKGADATGHAAYIKSTYAGTTSWHFSVDDHQAIQHIPTNENAWHAGDGTNGPGNRTSIGVEICENSDGNQAQAEANAIDLIIDLMKQFNIPLANVVPHKHWTGKECPHLILPRWDAFIAAITKRQQERDLAERLAKVPDWARGSVKKLLLNSVVDEPSGDLTFYRVIVVLDRLGLIA